MTTEGVFDLPKDGAVAIATGETVYWDAAAGNVNKENSGTRLGYAVETKAAAATTIKVRLVPSA